MQRGPKQLLQGVLQHPSQLLYGYHTAFWQVSCSALLAACIELEHVVREKETILEKRKQGYGSVPGLDNGTEAFAGLKA